MHCNGGQRQQGPPAWKQAISKVKHITSLVMAASVQLQLRWSKFQSNDTTNEESLFDICTTNCLGYDRRREERALPLAPQTFCPENEKRWFFKFSPLHKSPTSSTCPPHRTAGPGSKATIFCGRALRSRTVFTEIIISTFLPVALLSCLPVRLITIFPLFVLCFLNTGAHIATSSSLPETKKTAQRRKKNREKNSSS